MPPAKLYILCFIFPKTLSDRHCYRALVLKLECALETPGGLVKKKKTGIDGSSHPTPRECDSVGMEHGSKCAFLTSSPGDADATGSGITF